MPSCLSDWKVRKNWNSTADLTPQKQGILNTSLGVRSEKPWQVIFPFQVCLLTRASSACGRKFPRKDVEKKKCNARLGVCQAVESLYFLIPLCPSSQLVNLVDISSVKNNLKLKLRNNIELKQIHQAPVVQTLDSAIQRINPHPVDKY